MGYLRAAHEKSWVFMGRPRVPIPYPYIEFDDDRFLRSPLTLSQVMKEKRRVSCTPHLAFRPECPCVDGVTSSICFGLSAELSYELAPRVLRVYPFEATHGPLHLRLHLRAAGSYTASSSLVM